MNPDNGSGGGRPVLLRRERLLLSPPVDHAWWRSHAQGPTVLPLGDRAWRVYFAGRDAGNRSHIIYADFDPSRDFELTGLHSEPLLALGLPGTFDHTGMVPSSVLRDGKRVLLYYIGFSLRRDVPHQLAIGLALSEDHGMTFRRAVPGPVLAIGPFDPYFVSTPYVARTGDGFQMHYASGIGWEGREYRCQIKCARSVDGVMWVAGDGIAVGLADAAEAAVARPAVVRRAGGHHMWYCHRGPLGADGVPAPPYHLGYAGSRDGLAWQRCDELLRFANPPQPGDWDCEMQAYPCVVPHGDELFVFYNGNGFGKSGFGLARIVM